MVGAVSGRDIGLAQGLAGTGARRRLPQARDQVARCPPLVDAPTRKMRGVHTVGRILKHPMRIPGFTDAIRQQKALARMSPPHCLVLTQPHGAGLLECAFHKCNTIFVLTREGHRIAVGDANRRRRNVMPYVLQMRPWAAAAAARDVGRAGRQALR